jgi:GDPmannose 4,6-dehydratase
VVASGESHTVREFCERAFAEVELDYRDYVKVDERFYRPAEVDELVGDASKAHAVLGWQPAYSFDEMIGEMVQADLATNTRLAGTNPPLATVSSPRK